MCSGEKEKEIKKSLVYSSIAEQMMRPLDRSKICLNNSFKKDEKDIKVIDFLINYHLKYNYLILCLNYRN